MSKVIRPIRRLPVQELRRIGQRDQPLVDAAVRAGKVTKCPPKYADGVALPYIHLRRPTIDDTLRV